jgi:filamentous hemagglutinin family protein
MSTKVKNSYQALYLTTALITSIALMHPAKSYAVGPLETPTGQTVVGGAATFANPVAGQLNINQSTDRVIINWNSFNIGANATTQFKQPKSSSLAVNRVLSPGTDPTQILGTLKANGRVMVLDRNGVIFQPGSTVNVGSIIASTGDVSNATVMSAATKIPLEQSSSTGTVENDGTITVADGGLAALVAPNVLNNGTINAKVGKVYLAAGQTATVDLFGDGLISLATPSNLTHALIGNTGTINAEGGTVTMSTAAAAGIVDNLINVNGLVNASSATKQGGKIILTGDAKVKVAGTLNADGDKGGGTIDIAGHNIGISGSATAKSASHKGGDIAIHGTGTVDVSGTVDASGQPLGGNILLSGNKVDIGVNGSALALGGDRSGKGGTIELYAIDYAQIVGLADASGGAGGGNIVMNGRNVDISGTAKAYSKAAGQGGNVDLNADAYLAIEGLVDVHGIDGGGNITATAQNGLKVTQSSQLLANSTVHGAGGIITLNGVQSDIMNGVLNANGVDRGGRINVVSDEGKLDFEGSATAQSTTHGSGGVINLAAAKDINESGNVDASGVDHGGWINVTGGGNLILSGNAYARATTHGSGGDIDINIANDARASGTIDVSGADHGGSVDFNAGNSLNVSSTILARAFNAGVGGSINLSAPTLRYSGLLDVDGVNGGGNVGLTGDTITSTGNISADALVTGDGGTITYLGSIIDYLFSGTLTATGGALAGNGGTVNISTPNVINPAVVVDVSAPNGSAGTYIH